MAERASRKRTPAAKRIAEALSILQALKVPREQQNERSALTLLALLAEHTQFYPLPGFRPRLRVPGPLGPMAPCSGA